MAAITKLDSLIDALGASFDFTMQDLSGHLTERIGAHNTTSETGLTYGVQGLRALPLTTAVSFDGTTSDASSASNAAFDFADTFTLVICCTFTDNGANRIPFDRGHVTGNAWMVIKKTTNVVALADSTAGTVICNVPADTDNVNPHVYAFDKNGATNHAYRDGKDVTVAGTNVTLANSTSTIHIGDQPGFAFHKGPIYRFIGFSTVLSAANHLALANALLDLGPAPAMPTFLSKSLAFGLSPRSAPVFPPGGSVANVQNFSASVGFTSSEQRAVTHGLPTASLGFTSSQRRAIVHGLPTAILSFTSSQAKAIVHGLPTAVLSFTGSVRRAVVHQLPTAVLGFASSQQRAVGKAFAPVLSFTSSQGRAIVRGLSAALSFTSSQRRAIVHTFSTAVLSFTGSLTSGRQFIRSFAASLGFTGSQQRGVGKTLSASLGFTGSIRKAIAKRVSAVLAFAGNLGVVSSALAIAGGVGPVIASAISSVASTIASHLRASSTGESPDPSVTGSSDKPSGTGSSPRPQ